MKANFDNLENYINSRRDLINETENRTIAERAMSLYYRNLNIRTYKDIINMELLYENYTDKLTDDETKYIKGECPNVSIPDICQAMKYPHRAYLHECFKGYETYKTCNLVNFIINTNLSYLDKSYDDFLYNVVNDSVNILSRYYDIVNMLSNISSECTIYRYDELIDNIQEYDLIVTEFMNDIGCNTDISIGDKITYMESMCINPLHDIIKKFNTRPDKEKIIDEYTGITGARDKSIIDSDLTIKVGYALAEYDKLMLKYANIIKYQNGHK